MDRRNFLGGVAMTLAGPAMAGVGSEWLGGKALAGGKGYAPGRFGQIHYRVLGEGAGAAAHAVRVAVMARPAQRSRAVRAGRSRSDMVTSRRSWNPKRARD